MKDKAKSYLGLSMRAGKIAAGEDQVLKAVRSGQAKLVLVAKDASDNTKKLYRDKCGSYQVACIIAYSMAEIGACIGKQERAAVAVTDQGLAGMIAQSLKNQAEVEHIE